MQGVDPIPSIADGVDSKDENEEYYYCTTQTASNTKAMKGVKLIQLSNNNTT